MTQSPNPGLALLRNPFPPEMISKLPKPTRAQTDAVRQDFRKGIRCKICGAWHHPDVVHLDYVGHAALTDRLLDADPEWNWEPVCVDDFGAPRLDNNNGMWIRLTVCGVTRLGYGHADQKTGGDAIKEVIGDALRNAAMRFGAALALWHKGDFPQHDDDAHDGDENSREREQKEVVAYALALQLHKQDAAKMASICDVFAIDQPTRKVLASMSDDILDEFTDACSDATGKDK